ncbi:hypothetical protein [Sphingomonas paucimobilis]|uniref:hypothetical protein n=1 Tax=Sphingomonas paucimobilis TaxID=13689 RepID=UPI00064BCBCA|nr:hypothetical protein [Sphingomonas paucimobilis]
MVSEMDMAWDAAFQKWQTARAAVDAAPADLPGKEDDQLLAIDGEAWCELLALPAPDWAAAAWKVRQLLDPGTNNQTSGWDGDLVRPLFADLDRLLPKPEPLQRLGQRIDQLIAQAKSQNGTACEYQSPAAPDQHKSEEIIVADTANSTAVPRPEGITPIRQLAMMRQTALDRGERPVSNRDDEADRHWDRRFQALGIAIAGEPPRNLVDALTVLECVSGMHDALNHSDMTEGDHVRFLDTVGAAINHCLPIIASALAPEDLTEGQRGHIAWAAAASARRENPNG